MKNVIDLAAHLSARPLMQTRQCFSEKKTRILERSRQISKERDAELRAVKRTTKLLREAKANGDARNIMKCRDDLITLGFWTSDLDIRRRCRDALWVHLSGTGFFMVR